MNVRGLTGGAFSIRQLKRFSNQQNSIIDTRTHKYQRLAFESKHFDTIKNVKTQIATIINGK